MAQNLGAKKGQFSGWRNRLDGVLSTVKRNYTQEKRVVKVGSTPAALQLAMRLGC